MLQITTPLGENVFLATEVSGTEALSELFSFQVDVSSRKVDVSPDSLLGKSVTVKISRPKGAPRYINGIVTTFAARDQYVDESRRYRLVITPRLWLLTRTTDCRIFQNKTVLDIADTLLSEGGITDYQKKNLSGTHPVRDYCVQYRESDFDFLARILAEEGIFFFFEHADGKHTLILSDSPASYLNCADTNVTHAPAQAGTVPALYSWDNGFAFRSGKSTLSDYDFEQPDTDLTASTSTVLKNSAFKSWERYDYPGDYTPKATGSAYSRVRMEHEEAHYQIVRGASGYAGFLPGSTFSISAHEVSAEKGKAYVLQRVVHEGRDLSHLGNQDEPVVYRNRFEAAPSSTPFRPARDIRRPLIPGPQTALVVGPQGEEIYCDKYGRVRVQFHWDRLGSKNEKSSCWVRVSQSMAGSGWGAVFTPRVGMEVLVEFLEGDPDRPLITGCLYNGKNLPPYSLPDNKTQSGIKTRSSMQGDSSTFNELRFEDKKGSELIYVHAQKDHTRDVENDDTLNVQHDQTITIKNNRTETVQEGHESVTVSKGNRDVTISQGNENLTVSQGNLTTTVSQGNHAVKVAAGNATLKCDGGSITMEAASSITLKVGGNSVVINQSGVTVKGTQVNITGDAKVQVKGAMVNVNGDGTVQIKGGIVTIN
ncbi:type VI secretion system Vgr family protein [Xanthobacter sp. TB0139]|uniref:type VI secretion system Vgr family protein n=1 Tax=Xanthobacter sp. TB0139 TaxID=3459178 RepID=UPI004039A849